MRQLEILMSPTKKCAPATIREPNLGFRAFALCMSESWRHPCMCTSFFVA